MSPLLSLLSMPPCRAMLDLVDVAILVQGRRAEIVYANRLALELLGGDASQVIDSDSFDPAWNVITADGRPALPEERPVARVLATGAPVHDQVLGIWHASADERVWLLVNAEPHHDDAGEVALVVVTLQRITDELTRNDLLEDTRDLLRHAVQDKTEELARVEAELASTQARLERAQHDLKAQEELYRSVFEAVQEGLVVHAADGTIKATNPAAERILGLSSEQLMGRAAVDPRWRLENEHGAPFDPEQIPSERTRRTGEVIRRQLIAVHRRTGERAWLQVSTNPIHTHGELTGVVATFADVTRERAATQGLKASQARFKRVTEAVPGVLFQLALRSTAVSFTFLSRHVADVFGVTAAEAMAEPQRLLDQIRPEDRRELLVAQKRALDRREPLEVIVGLTNQRWIRTRAVAEDQNGCVVWSGVVLDVTEEHTLAEQLRHSQRREAMGDLAAGVAHNFNNALAAVLPNLEELRGSTDADQRHLVDDALKAARNAADLVRQLMLTTRRETAKREPVDLSRVVRDVVLLCRRSFDRRIHIDESIEVTTAMVLARESELHQVLLNLCINARDALSHVPDPRLTVSVRRQRNTLVVEVADNGCGMKPEVQRRLGEPFFTTKAPGRGTGLGLATAYKVLADIDAQMHCQSTEGEGTDFTIEIPGILARPQREERRSQPPGRHGFDGQRVLVVDDDNLVRRAMRRQLCRLNLEVEEAADGVQCLQRLRRGPLPRVLVLDLSMPRLSGEEVLSTVRTTYPELPVIVVSGHVPERASLSEADAVLIKPIEGDGLAVAIGRVLGAEAEPAPPLKALERQTV